METGVYPNMLGLEMSLHHHNNIPQQNPHHHMQQQQQIPTHPPMHHPPPNFSFPFVNKAKTQSLTFSDDDEPGPNNNSADNMKGKSCPWQRMKWTDHMIRLLIMIVYYIGDEVGSEGVVNDPNGKKKGGGGGGVGSLQKKGKWKSVSRAMMERGFYVSPQQCEDKFNDLNKRYKRVNDILGKGTACRVVENQSLLETMDHLSPKMKEEVKKLLNSKHLFFREMCAYHNSCGHGSGGGTSSGNVIQHSPEVVAVEANSQEKARMASFVEGSKVQKVASLEIEDDDEEEDDDEDDHDDDKDNDDDHDDEDDDDDMDERSRKRQRKMSSMQSPMVEELNKEMANVIQDCGKSPLEKRQWLKTRMMQLEEQHVSYMCQAFKLQKQKLKWKKFTSKKEREMKREKLSNERKKLENERMVLLLRQKELELLDFHHQQQHHHMNNNNRHSDPSSVTG